eukprot:Skav224668  [mRNA]  locus=scaffold3549:96362:105031:+ [translate_table: standard]
MPLPPGLHVDDPFDWYDGSESEPSIQGPVTASDSDEHWRCARCFGDTFYQIGSTWFCSVCDHTEYINSNSASRRDTSEGTWIFVPRSQQPPDSRDRSNNLQRRRNGSGHNSGGDGTNSNPDVSADAGFRGRNAEVLGVNPTPPPSNPSDRDERAESETPTDDPVVDPGLLNRRQRRRRAQRRNAQAAPQVLPDHAQPAADAQRLQQSLDNLVRTLQQDPRAICISQKSTAMSAFGFAPLG